MTDYESNDTWTVCPKIAPFCSLRKILPTMGYVAYKKHNNLIYRTQIQFVHHTATLFKSTQGDETNVK